MPGRPYVLAEATWKTVRETRYEVAILPWGATEAHNTHLPYGTDTVESERIAAESAGLAWAAGARVLVLPAVPFGVQSGQLDVPFCLHVAPSTQLALLADIAATVDRHGVRKLVLMNGHGGNELRGLIRELQPDVDVFLCLVNTYACLDARAFFDEPGDHAGEMETSLMQHLAPELVLPLDQAGRGQARPFRIAGLREGWAWAPRQWTEVTEDTGVGDPRAATAEKGAAFFRTLTERIAGFLVELAAMDPDHVYL